MYSWSSTRPVTLKNSATDRQVKACEYNLWVNYSHFSACINFFLFVVVFRADKNFEEVQNWPQTTLKQCKTWWNQKSARLLVYHWKWKKNKKILRTAQEILLEIVLDMANRDKENNRYTGSAWMSMLLGWRMNFRWRKFKDSWSFQVWEQFLIVDTRIVDVTIVRTRNVQICHSLRCKQIDNYVNGRSIHSDFPK